TNYKMLDQLLLRHEDAKLWKESATSLQYLVLDEFHTYDGAQGTDVAMLLRRLGTTLKAYWQDQAARTHIQLTQEDRERPLGIITPVATSATLGGSGGGQDMLDFAETIFGERFAHDALITESRMDFETWKNQSSPGAAANRDIEDISYLITDTNKKIENDATSATTL